MGPRNQVVEAEVFALKGAQVVTRARQTDVRRNRAPIGTLTTETAFMWDIKAAAAPSWRQV
jgi:hypothetical protein